MKHRTMIIGVVVATAVVGASAIALRHEGSSAANAASSRPGSGTGSGSGGGGSTAGAAPNLATVDKRDLGRSEDLDGVVGHGAQWSLRLSGGVLTRLPSVGDVVQFGQRLAEVDGEPVVLLQGDRPAWRTLGPGVGKGEDVRQLEAALVAMGYADPSKVIVDDTWTAATTAAVKAMQRLVGMPDDGRLDLGEVVFSQQVARIAKVAGNLGDSAGAAGIEATGMRQSVSVSLKAAKADLVKAGDTVTVKLPDASTVSGTVADISAAVVAADGGVTFSVTITTPAIDLVDGVPVKVSVSVVDVKGATAVPAEALLALAEGGYGVEVPDATAAAGKRLVAVQVGEFADGWVQVTGGIKPGDKVVVP